MSARNRAEVERLRLWIRRIDNINDDPACFNKEIDEACAAALRGDPCRGRIRVTEQKTLDDNGREYDPNVEPCNDAEFGMKP